MKDPIQRNGGEVAIVIYDAPLPPKYFRLTKRFIRTLFIVAPLFFASIITLLFIWGLGERLKDAPTPTIPEVITEADSPTIALEAEIKTLKETNEALTTKLSQAPSNPTGTAEEPYLSVIKKPYGMQNLIAEKRISLDQLEFTQDATKANFKFQIISSNPENKVTGHILVFMISGSGLTGYPAGINASASEGIKYSMGETFAVSRLRPTNAEFLTKPAGQSVKFLVYIFSREGDLLLVRESEAYNLGGAR